MRIRTALLVAFATAVVLCGSRIAANVIAVAERDDLDRLDALAAAVVRDAARMRAAAADGLQREDPAIQRQGDEALRGLADAAKTLDAQGDGAWPQVATIRALATGLPELADALRRARTPEGADTPAALSLSQDLALRTVRLAEHAFELNDAVGAERRRLRSARNNGSAVFWGGTLLLLGLAAWGARRRILLPVQALSDAAHAIAEGRFDARSGHRTRDELGELSTAFDTMAQALQDRDRRLAEARRQSDALLDTLHAHAIVSVADRSGRIVDANDNFCRISGYSRDELIGQNHRMLRSGVQPAAFWQDMWRTIAAGQPWRGEVCNRAKDGSLYWVDSLVAPFRDAEGRIERYVSIRIDVTEAKRFEQRLAASERFLRQVSDALPMRLYYVGADNTFQFANRAVWQTYGDRPDAVIGRPCEQVLGRADHPLRLRMLDALAGAEQRFEFRQVVDGEERHAEVRLLPDIAEDGSVRGAIGANFDVTDRKRAAQELSQTTELLRAVLDAASEVAIVVTDADGTIRLFNRGAERLLGRAAEEVVGRERLQAFVDADERERLAGELAMTSGRVVAADDVLFDETLFGQARAWTCGGPGDASRRLTLTVTRMAGTGERASHLTVAYDVTLRERQEASLREAVERARQADVAKSRFLANMSHEIRTPMNAVLGLSYLLEQTTLDALQASHLQRMRQSGRLLLRLLDDVLDLSKIEAGELTLERVPFKLRHLVRDVVEFGRNQAAARSLAFQLEFDGDVPEVLEGDPVRVSQVLGNLLANAVKFTERGSVSLRIGAAGGGTGVEPMRLRFTVADTGIGIDAEARQRIFEPFIQADDSVTRRFGGTGLGLSIVRHLLDRMNGSLTLTSRPGEGSRFVVEIPFGVSSPAMLTWHQLGSAPASHRALAGVRVLVVDDSDVNRDVAERILQLHGASVVTARDGAEAVERLRADPELCDVVLMDVQMPRMDGCEATRRIRGELGLGRLPIVALTAAVMSSELAKTRAAGMSGYISKPFEPHALVRSVQALVADDAERAGPVTAGLDSADHMPRHDADDAAAPWPHVEGIDSTVARRRLGGDARLFLRLLGRLLDEHADLQPDGTAAATRTELARRLHRLRGAAGTLGAESIAALAHDAERACQAPDDGSLVELMEALSEELALLRRHARAALHEAAPAADRRTAEAEPPAAVADALLALLRQRDMAAVSLLETHRASLVLRHGETGTAELQDLVEDLRFDEAAAWLGHH